MVGPGDRAAGWCVCVCVACRGEVDLTCEGWEDLAWGQGRSAHTNLSMSQRTGAACGLGTGQ